MRKSLSHSHPAPIRDTHRPPRILHYDGTSANPTPIMSQLESDLSTTKPYQLTFYYDLHSIVQATGCTLSVTLGEALIYTRTLTSADDPRTYSWKGPETTIPTIPTSKDQTLSFKYECVSMGNQANTYLYIFLDHMFLSYPAS